MTLMVILVKNLTLNVENSNVDEPDIIRDSSKTIDENAEHRING